MDNYYTSTRLIMDRSMDRSGEEGVARVVYIPSEDELEAMGGGDFANLPPDQYRVEFISREIKGKTYPRVENQPDPYKRTEEHPAGEPRDVLHIVMLVKSFADGTPLVDVNGDDPKGEVLFFDFLDTTKVGLKPQASKFRKFLAAAFNVDIKAGVNIQSWQDLFDKVASAQFNVGIEHNKKGQHKVKDYTAIRTRPVRRAAPAEAAPAPAPTETISDEDLKARAAEVFGDDAPPF